MTLAPLCLDAANPGPLTGRGNNTWLLDGAAPALVDAGVGEPPHLDAIAAALAGRPLACVLVTHSHPDHASGVPALCARWPQLVVAEWADRPGAASSAARRPLHDGDRVPAGNAEVIVIHTPGHAPDHVCFWNAGTRELFAGDMVQLGTTVMIPAGRGGRLRDYLASLERLAALRPVRIYPGHGPVIEEPLALIAEYLAHRRLRESQIRACLDDGLTSVDAIVARVYPDLDPAVVPAARLTVEAHLEKIREDDGPGV
jgi:glyoxylase-like metal-dependent hydrolase (beta-lactamase superfamily II)